MPSRASVILDFESLTDGDVLNNQFPGMAFQNATVLTAGISLNEFEFPPRSGSNVVFDDGGPITITFGGLVFAFGGYVTYSSQISITAFNLAGDKVAQAIASFNSNLAITGDAGSSPNELLAVEFVTGISRITIGGNPTGASFTMDDALFTNIPEPIPMFLYLSGLAVMFISRKTLPIK
ncbi:MAG: hypothetical protein SFV18_18215 [Bryobacteraceae bacterium]|nr:hypothetical protein [Bryobacteraceae bacterium]